MARGSSDESYDPKATFGPHSGSCTPPEDWDCEGSSYNPTLVQIQSQWNEFLAFASEIPTRSGDPAVFIHPWLPWYAPVLTTILVLWLHFCPSSLENALDGRSPAGATFSDGTTTLISSTWQLIHLALGPAYWSTVRLNIIPFEFPYGGQPTDVYSKENFALVMDEYHKFVLRVIHLADKSQFCSVGVRERFKKLLGGEKKYAEFAEENESKFVSPQPPVHPEKLLNAMFHSPNSFESECAEFDAVYTDVRKHLGADGESVVGANIFNKVEGSEAFEHKKEASRQALERGQAVLCMAWLAYWDGCPTEEQLGIIAAILDALERGREWMRKAWEAHKKGKADEKQTKFVEDSLEHIKEIGQRKTAALDKAIGLIVSSARTLRSTVRVRCPVCDHEENTRGTVPATEDTARQDRAEIEVFPGKDSPTGPSQKFTNGYLDVIDKMGMPHGGLKTALATEVGGVVKVKRADNSGGHPVGTQWYVRYTPIPERLCVIDRCRKCKAEYDAGRCATGSSQTMGLVDLSQYFRTTTMMTIRLRMAKKK